MTPLEHYQRAEELLDKAQLIVDTFADQPSQAESALRAVTQLTARAHVHATLATIPTRVDGGASRVVGARPRAAS